MLLTTEPRIASIDLRQAGTASDYRGVDFRKPLINRNGTGASPDFVDIPVYNGKYSTSCYVDEMQRALEDMYRKDQLSPIENMRSVEAVFMHRPYQRMPETGWGMAYLFALANGDQEALDELNSYCIAADVKLEDFISEVHSAPDLATFGVRERISDEIFPRGLSVLKVFRRSEAFENFVRKKIQLGAEGMLELGNLYTAALPAWLAAGLEDARATNVPLENKKVLLVGYGSGDAADAIPMRIEPGWQSAAESICFHESLEPSIDLSHDQYLALRDRGETAGLVYAPSNEFVVDRVGSEITPIFQDAGIEYYRYIQ
jgi:hydroxymethylglutaryl-CoA synthase